MRPKQESVCGHLPVRALGLCKSCYNKNYKKTHPEIRTAKSRRSYYLKARFGLTQEEYEALLAQNNGSCWICGNKPKEKQRSLNVDHDHKVKEKSMKAIRGLLCWRCNNGLSFFRDNPVLFERAAEYLKGTLFNRSLNAGT